MFFYEQRHYLWSMKSALVIVLTLTMLFKPLWPIVEYVVNYDYIVNVLCENKDNVALQCDGKCYLAQQIAKEAKEGPQNPFDKKQTKTELQYVVFYQLILDYNFNTYQLQDSTENFKTITLSYAKLFATVISEPPEFISSTFHVKNPFLVG